MEEENDSSNVIGMVPLALSILAVLLGAAGLYFGLTANQRLAPLSESLDAGNSSAARVEAALEATDTKLVELAARFDELKKGLDRVRVYGSQNERSVKQLASAVQDNRKELVKLADGLNQAIAARPASPSNVAGAPPAAPSVGDSPSAAREGTYEIQSGDSFAKIAQKLGVGLQELLDANPDKDPRRLTIGAVINVPGQ